MTKKAQNMMKASANKRRSDTKLEKERVRKAKNAKRYKNKPAQIDIKTAEISDLKNEFEKIQANSIKKPGKDIKNKQKRQEIILQRSQRKKQIKSKIRRTNQKTREEEGDNAVESIQVKTIDNQREEDHTFVINDEEIDEETKNDEFTPYFNKEFDPQILITTSIRHTGAIFKFVRAIKDTIPNCYFYYRKKMDISELITFAKEKGFSHIMVILEEVKKPYRISIGYLKGKGLTVELKLADVVYRDEIAGSGAPTDHNPELIFKNFKTKLGFRLQRVLQSLFPIEEELVGRRIVTFHNQRDYIFFRHHRFQFEEDLEGVRLQELGPSFTMRLLSIQQGLFDREHGDFEFNYRDRMGIRRRKFYL